MSHVETAKVTITDLEALQKAAARLGAEFVQDKKTYPFFGRHVGDYPLPQGFTASEMGKCDHAIRVPGINYEVGVCRAKDGKGYTLLFDFYGHQRGGHDGELLRKHFGDKLVKLVDAYSIEALKSVARKKGYTTSESKLPNGKTKLLVTGFA